MDLMMAWVKALSWESPGNNQSVERKAIGLDWRTVGKIRGNPDRVERLHIKHGCALESARLGFNSWLHHF